MSGSPIYELLERSLERFVDRRLLICGDVLDEQLLKLARYTKNTTVLVDNYITAQAMAALVGQTFDSSCEQTINYKHLNICYISLENVKLDKFDTLLIMHLFIYIFQHFIYLFMYLLMYFIIFVIILVLPLLFSSF